jgi:hypothetical protein
MGSVFYDLVVPDYNASGLAMSGLLVSDEAARLQFTAQPDQELAAGSLPSPATSRRAFSQSVTLNLFAEVYDNIASRDPRQIEITTSLTGEDGKAAFTSRESLASNGARGDVKSARIPHIKQIPLKDVREGTYRLRVEAQARGSNAKPVARETTLTVIAAR